MYPKSLGIVKPFDLSDDCLGLHVCPLRFYELARHVSASADTCVRHGELMGLLPAARTSLVKIVSKIVELLRMIAAQTFVFSNVRLVQTFDVCE